MTDLHKILNELGECARDATPPNVDVRQRVMESLAIRSQVLPPDPTPLAFCGVAIALAVSLLIAFLPLWQTLSEPWACYLPH